LGEITDECAVVVALIAILIHITTEERREKAEISMFTFSLVSDY
jgi:hypothetical protein